MKYRLFEQAADEARAGIDELDAEIDRLNARRELLQVLDALVHQALTVLPMNAQPLPAGAAPCTQVNASVAEQPSLEGSFPEDGSNSVLTAGQVSESVARATEEMSFAGGGFSSGDRLESETDAAGREDLPVHFAEKMRTDSVATEQVNLPEDLRKNEAKPHQEEESAGESAEGTEDDEPAAEYPSLAELLWREEPYSLRKRGWPAPSSTEDEREIRKKLL